MNESASILESGLPFDICLKIASYLPVLDVCVLSRCSRYWRELCSSDSIWESLARRRWPAAAFPRDSSASLRWREVYAGKHREMAIRAGAVVGFVNQCCGVESMEVGDYVQAIGELSSLEFSYADVRMFLFKPHLSVLLNLVALHYSIACLQTPAWEVVAALKSCWISERQVCVKWWKLGRWFYGFRMRDESHSRHLTLAELATEKGIEVLGVLRRGAIHEVLRVVICVSDGSSSSPWPRSNAQNE
ncbi:unnamed protein product [Linum tenue]|uniref:F-box domain-containing protein n=1 Tax=Linum tenue TaxID=586396 RepID=A0AAV0P689_9ROSI|nr:unnamed protein product [Linum tenue]